MTYEIVIDQGLDDILYRAFEDIEHAKMFQQGKLRLKLLEEYKKIESNNRVDPEEGSSRYVVEGVNGVHVTCSGSWTNPKLVLCCASPEVNLACLKKSMGST